MKTIRFIQDFATNFSRRFVAATAVIVMALFITWISPRAAFASAATGGVNIRSAAPDQPTVVWVAEFQVEKEPDGVVQVSWTTGVEIDLLGFNLYRQNPDDGSLELVNADGMILATQSGQTIGDHYTYPDGEALAEETPAYWLQLVRATTEPVLFGPAAVASELMRIYLPAVIH
jgi:hypothetical protein